MSNLYNMAYDEYAARMHGDYYFGDGGLRYQAIERARAEEHAAGVAAYHSTFPVDRVWTPGVRVQQPSFEVAVPQVPDDVLRGISRGVPIDVLSGTQATQPLSQHSQSTQYSQSTQERADRGRRLRKKSLTVSQLRRMAAAERVRSMPVSSGAQLFLKKKHSIPRYAGQAAIDTRSRGPAAPLRQTRQRHGSQYVVRREPPVVYRSAFDYAPNFRSHGRHEFKD